MINVSAGITYFSKCVRCELRVFFIQSFILGDVALHNVHKTIAGFVSFLFFIHYYCWDHNYLIKMFTKHSNKHSLCGAICCCNDILADQYSLSSIWWGDHLNSTHLLCDINYFRGDIYGKLCDVRALCVCPMRNTKEINIKTGRIRNNKNNDSPEPLETVNFEIPEINVLINKLIWEMCSAVLEHWWKIEKNGL